MRAIAAASVRQATVSISALRNLNGNGGIVGASQGVEKPERKMSASVMGAIYVVESWILWRIFHFTGSIAARVLTYTLSR